MLTSRVAIDKKDERERAVLLTTYINFLPDIAWMRRELCQGTATSLPSGSTLMAIRQRGNAGSISSVCHRK